MRQKNIGNSPFRPRKSVLVLFVGGLAFFGIPPARRRRNAARFPNLFGTVYGHRPFRFRTSGNLLFDGHPFPSPMCRERVAAGGGHTSVRRRSLIHRPAVALASRCRCLRHIARMSPHRNSGVPSRVIINIVYAI